MMFLSLRALHVLIAATWIGATVFISMVLMPAIEQSGPAGGEVMVRLNRLGLNRFMAILGGVTVVTGLYLLWRFTGGFDPPSMESRGAHAFLTGGTAGILAAIIGGSVVGRGAAKIVDIMGEAAKAPGGQARDLLLQQAATLRQRIKTAGAVVIVLQVTALILMAVAHYI